MGVSPSDVDYTSEVASMVERAAEPPEHEVEARSVRSKHEVDTGGGANRENLP